MSEPVRRIRRKPRVDLNAIHDRLEWFKEQGFRIETGEKLDHDPDERGVRVTYTVSEWLPLGDS